MEAIVAIVTTAPKTRVRLDDDTFDRLHHFYTAIILVVFAVVVTLFQYIGNPVTCWADAEFQGGWIKYMNNFCWVKNTYFLPFENEIPREYEPELRREIVYYQWTPFLFLVMALGFYLPNLVWHTFNSKAGVDSDNILEAAGRLSSAQQFPESQKILQLITNQFDRFLGNPRMVGGSTKIKGLLSKLSCCGKRFGNYLILLFLFAKLLFIVNVSAQLFLLNLVLKTDSQIFGVELLQNALSERVWLNNTIFPKVTFCDFYVRRLGNVHRYSVQCLLPVNLYTEIMFVFLWFWMALVLILSVIAFLIWFIKALFINDRYRFIESNLVIAGRINRDRKDDREKCLNFVRHYLRVDGVFVMRLIRHNTNGITANEILASVWDNWINNNLPPGDLGSERDKRPNGPFPDDIPLKKLPEKQYPFVSPETGAATLRKPSAPDMPPEY